VKIAKRWNFPLCTVIQARLMVKKCVNFHQHNHAINYVQRCLFLLSPEYSNALGVQRWKHPLSDYVWLLRYFCS